MYLAKWESEPSSSLQASGPSLPTSETGGGMEPLNCDHEKQDPGDAFHKEAF